MRVRPHIDSHMDGSRLAESSDPAVPTTVATMLAVRAS